MRTPVTLPSASIAITARTVPAVTPACVASGGNAGTSWLIGSSGGVADEATRKAGAAAGAAIDGCGIGAVVATGAALTACGLAAGTGSVAVRARACGATAPGNAFSGTIEMIAEGGYV